MTLEMVDVCYSIQNQEELHFCFISAGRGPILKTIFINLGLDTQLGS